MAGSEFSDEVFLVKALTARDPNAFAFLLDQYHAPLMRVARQYVPNQAVAEEVVQDTWLAAIEGIDRFEQRASVKTWLFRILINIARSRGVAEHRTVPFSTTALGDGERAVDPHRFRKFPPSVRGQWKVPPRPWDDPEQRALDRETLEVISRAIGQLPTDQREVITMRDLLGWSASEACAALDVSDANQRVLLHRARSKIRTELEGHYDQGRADQGHRA